MVPKLITLEEHFTSSDIEGAVEHEQGWPGAISTKLQGIGHERVKDMDDGSVNIQVISHSPIIATPEQCRIGNNHLARACKEHNKRFAGFAMLPMLHPTEAPKELERAVKELNFVGALINNHEDGTFYDDGKYWTVFEKAEELDVPIYIHPSYPSQKMAAHYNGNYSDQAAFMFSIASWGWHSETGLHILRLFAAGLFDKFPKLKIIIGHDGEMLPFMLDRILPHSKHYGQFQRDLLTVWKENIWVTTSNMFSQAPLACLLRVSNIDHIMYSIDYPFASTQQGLAFIKDLEKSDLVSAEDLEMICHKNAQKLLKLRNDY